MEATLVLNSESVSIRPFESTFTPADSRPRSLVNGRRPIDNRTTSTSVYVFFELKKRIKF